MIRRALLRAGASLALLSLLGLTASAASEIGTTTNCKSGKAAGAWNLPAAGQPGSMRGVLAYEGQAQFHVQAMLVPSPSTSAAGPRRGEMRGVLSVSTSTGPMSIARVKGEWFARPNGKGEFRAVFVRPGASATQPVQLVGRMKGAFDDSSTAAPGKFRARWQICR